MPALPSGPRPGDPGFRVLQLAAHAMFLIGIAAAFLWACVPGEAVIPASIGFGGIALLILGALAEGWLKRVQD